MAAGRETMCVLGEKTVLRGKRRRSGLGLGPQGATGGTYTFLRPVVLSWGTCASSTTQSFSEGTAVQMGLRESISKSSPHPNPLS